MRRNRIGVDSQKIERDLFAFSIRWKWDVPGPPSIEHISCHCINLVALQFRLIQKPWINSLLCSKFFPTRYLFVLYWSENHSAHQLWTCFLDQSCRLMSTGYPSHVCEAVDSVSTGCVPGEKFLFSCVLGFCATGGSKVSPWFDAKLRLKLCVKGT